MGTVTYGIIEGLYAAAPGFREQWEELGTVEFNKNWHFRARLGPYMTEERNWLAFPFRQPVKNPYESPKLSWAAAEIIEGDTSVMACWVSPDELGSVIKSRNPDDEDEPEEDWHNALPRATLAFMRAMEGRCKAVRLLVYSNT